MEEHDPEKPITRRKQSPEAGPFVLRSLLEDLPLSADGDRNDIEINCVEFLGMWMRAKGLYSAQRNQKLTMSRPEPLCWYICLRNTPFLPNSTRP
jgi:hypothetical protein